MEMSELVSEKRQNVFICRNGKQQHYHNDYLKATKHTGFLRALNPVSFSPQMSRNFGDPDFSAIESFMKKVIDFYCRNISYQTGTERSDILPPLHFEALKDLLVNSNMTQSPDADDELTIYSSLITIHSECLRYVT